MSLGHLEFYLLITLMFVSIVFASHIKEKEMLHAHTSSSVEKLAAFTATISAEIEYKELIYVSVDISGASNNSKRVSAVLSLGPNKLYMKSEALNLSISDSNDFSIYGIGKVFEMDLNICHSMYKYEATILSNPTTLHDIDLSRKNTASRLPTITLIPDIATSETEKSEMLIEHSLSKGRLSDQSIDALTDCKGDMGEFHVSRDLLADKHGTTEAYAILVKKTSDYSLEIKEFRKFKLIVIWDFTLTKSEFSSGLLEKQDFDFLEIEDNSYNFVTKLDRRKLEIFEDGLPVIKLGVDVLRNMTIEMNLDIGLLRVCEAKPHSNKIQNNLVIPIEYRMAVLSQSNSYNSKFQVVFDTGSDITHIPESLVSKYVIGHRPFRYDYISGREASGTTTSLEITLPTREKSNILKPVSFQVKGGINSQDTGGLGFIQRVD
jgi:hypothetical protein